MMSFFQKKGLKVVCWMTPFINDVSTQGEVAGQLPSAPLFNLARSAGFFPNDATGQPLSVPWWKGKGGPVDFTNPAAKDWLTGQLKALLEQSQVVTKSGAKQAVISGFKTDDGEAATTPGSNNNPDGFYIPLEAKYHDGRKGAELQNGYCIEYLRTIFETLQEVVGGDALLFVQRNDWDAGVSRLLGWR